MPMTPLELGRRQIALVRAVKANSIVKVRRFLKDCRQWDIVHHRTGPHSDRESCSCCFRSDKLLFPARHAALRTAIALGLRDMVNLILDAGVQFSPGGRLSESFSRTAVQFDQIDILRLLLERNIGSAEQMEVSAVELAIMKGSLPLTEPFIEHGIVTRRQAMEMAIEYGKLEIVQAMTEKTLPPPELSVLLDDAQSSAVHGHLEVVKYFLELIRHKDKEHVPWAAFKVFNAATTAPILEWCMPLTDGITEHSRNKVLKRALSRGYTDAAGFLILHGATYDKIQVKRYLGICQSESHFIHLWNLLGGTANFSALTDIEDIEEDESSPIYYAIQERYWNVVDTCLRYPAFKMRKAHPSEMCYALQCALMDEQEKLLWHIIENVPEARPILLKDVIFPISRSPVLIRVMSRCRELLLPTSETLALRWEMSALADVFFNLIVHSKLRLMEAVVAPIGLDPETQMAAVIALRRTCLLTMRLMADALPDCNTIPRYFAHTICTEALERNEQVLFAIIRDALTGPSYPDGGFFYAHDKLKQRWLGIAVQQGHHDKSPSSKYSISIREEWLWRSAVKRAVDDGDHVILKLLRQTQYTYDANELALILLKPAFIANDHALLRYLGGVGVRYSPFDFSNVLLPAIYHDLDPDKFPKTSHHMLLWNHLEVSDADSDSEAMDTDEGELKQEGALFADPTSVPRPNQLCHAMCGRCLEDKFKKAKRVRSREVDGVNRNPDDASIDNIRVGCNTAKNYHSLQRIFPVTPSLTRVPLQDAQLFSSKDDAYVYFDYSRRFTQPNLLGKLQTNDYTGMHEDI
ncbi:hypothetical protein DFS34DRAFT_669508 [Phlyctochytrium arcticum]|nr:hypothetical protein DFS34DRAFT_669508 [Phlyctochytrium arcticum]